MRKEWYTAIELAGMPGLPDTKSGVIRKAKKETWIDRPREGKGGGREYHYGNLPPETVKHLAQLDEAERKAETQEIVEAGEHEAKKLQLKEKISQEAEWKARQEGVLESMRLVGKAASRDTAKHEIVNQFHSWVKSQGLQPKRGGKTGKAAVVQYCAKYAEGNIEVSEEARKLIPSMDPATLYRWLNNIKEGKHLGGHYGHRKGSGVIDSNPAMKEAVVAMLVKFPHASSKSVLEFIHAKFSGERTPLIRAVQRFIEHWKKSQAELHTVNTSPDQWKNQYMAAAGSLSAGVDRLNQRWELDSSPADVMLKDGRHSLIACIDVHSRRAKILVSKTSKAVAVGMVVRKAMLAWGVPEELKCDNGQDYRSIYLQQVCNHLGIVQDFSTPFSPWQKGHIERFFNTFSHGLVTLMDDFIGGSVAERKDIESRKAFADRLFKKGDPVEVRQTAAEFQAFCDEWCEVIYGREVQSGIGTTPFLMAQSWNQPITRIDNVRALDLLLAELPGNNGLRIVQKKGIRIDGGWYDAPEMGPYRGFEVQVRYTESLGKVVIYAHDRPTDILDTQAAVPGFHFVCVAECPERMGFSREEVAKARAELAGEVKRAQTAELNDKRKQGRELVKATGVDQAVETILDHKRKQAAEVTAFPARGAAHQSAGLAAAEQALAAQDQAVGKPAEVLQLPVQAPVIKEMSGFDRIVALFDLLMTGRQGELTPDDVEFITTFRIRFNKSVNRAEQLLRTKYEGPPERWEQYLSWRRAYGWPPVKWAQTN